MAVEHRRAAVVTLVVGVVGLVLLAVWRVPADPTGGSLPAVAAGRYFTAAEIARGNAWGAGARALSLVGLAVSLVLTGLVGFSRWGRRTTARVRGPWWWRVVVAVVALLLAVRVVTLPLAVIGWHRRRVFGLSEQGLGGFAVDVARAEAVTLVATTAVVLVVLALARRWTRAWPALVGALLGALVLVGSWAYPLVVEPLANSFTPLPDGPLRSGVLALAAREHVRVDDVLVADASRRTTTINAYVSGLGATRRVVLYDTLVEDLPRAEALSVVAHELTHAREDDVLTGSLLGAAGAVAAAGALGLLVGGRGWRHRLDAGDATRLLALAAAAAVLVAPVQDAVSRRLEARADVGALRATKDPAAFIALQQQLAVRSATDVTPPAAWTWWFATHPPARTRIALALREQDEGGGGS